AGAQLALRRTRFGVTMRIAWHRLLSLRHPGSRRSAASAADQSQMTSASRHLALLYGWSMIFFRKPGSTFRDHALEAALHIFAAPMRVTGPRWTAATKRGRELLLQRALHLLDAIALDRVALPHVLVALEGHTAFLAGQHLARVVLEALELRQL